MAKDWTQDEVIKDLERVIEKQDKEIERLREALRKIDAVKYYGPEGASMECDEMHEIARAALKEAE